MISFSTPVSHQLKPSFRHLTFQGKLLKRRYALHNCQYSSFEKCLISCLKKHSIYGTIAQSVEKSSCKCNYSTSFKDYWKVKGDHYSVLGVEKGASEAEIKKAFLKKSKECHPDLNQNDPNSQKKFVRLNEAYAALTQSAKSRHERKYNDAKGTQARYQDPEEDPIYEYPEQKRYQSEYKRINLYSKENIYNRWDKEKLSHDKSPELTTREKLEALRAVVTVGTIFLLCLAYTRST